MVDFLVLSEVPEYVALFLSLNFIMLLTIFGYYMFGRSMAGIILMQIIGIILVLLFFPHVVNFFSI